MANILKVTPQEVTEKAKAITSVKSNMENLLTELNSRIKAMTSEDWIGNAGTAYEFRRTRTTSPRQLPSMRSLKTARLLRQAIWIRPIFSPEHSGHEAEARRRCGLPPERTRL